MSRKPKPKKFNVTSAEFSNLADALFIGNHDNRGSVIMVVNAKGRACVDALFPHAHIAWHDTGDAMPADWYAFDIDNLPDVIAATETKLPLEIIGGADLDEASPDALAFLLVVGVHDQGGRSAIWWHEGCLEIFVPPGSNN